MHEILFIVHAGAYWQIRSAERCRNRAEKNVSVRATDVSHVGLIANSVSAVEAMKELQRFFFSFVLFCFTVIEHLLSYFFFNTCVSVGNLLHISFSLFIIVDFCCYCVLLHGPGNND